MGIKYFSCTSDKKILDKPWNRNSYPTKLSYPGYDKNRDFSRVWYALVVMDIIYAIVKIYVTERSDVIKQ